MSYGFSLDDIPPPFAMAPLDWDFAIEQTSLPPISTLEKYWGSISVLQRQPDGTVWKLIHMHAGTQSSLEYHVTKSETYHLLSGELIIGIRIGRAENRVLPMREGEMFHIPPGLMHMRMAKTEVTILERASHDDPKDSHIVEDGTNYVHRVR